MGGTTPLALFSLSNKSELNWIRNSARLHELFSRGNGTMMSPAVTAKIGSVEAKLAELDPIFRNFCSKYGFNLRGGPELGPRRRVWRREEIDRAMDLSMDLSVPQIIERGFYPEMPWSLQATASLLPTTQPARLLTRELFQGVRYSELSDILVTHLEDGQRALSAITQHDVISRGTLHRSPTS